MDDYISRQAAIDYMRRYAIPEDMSGWSIIAGLYSLPSAQPEEQWIPVSERLPEDENKVLLTAITEKGLRRVIMGYYMIPQKIWACMSIGIVKDIIAWKPLPKPYGGESE